MPVSVFYFSPSSTLLLSSPLPNPQQVMDMDVELLDKKIDQMMPELGFK